MSKPSLDLLNDIAEEHDQTRGFTPRLIQCRFRALAVVIPKGSVLDFGCADGVLTEMLAKRYGRVVAVDASRLRVERTAKRCEGLAVNVYESYFEDFEPPGNERFDAVVLSCILEHLEEPVALLRTAATHLKPGGRVAAIVPHGRSVHRRAGVHMGLLDSIDALGEADDALDHKRVYTKELLRAELEAAGLAVEAEGGILFKPLPNAVMSELSPELVDAYEALGRDLPELAAEVYAVGRLADSGEAAST